MITEEESPLADVRVNVCVLFVPGMEGMYTFSTYVPALI